MDSKDNLVAVKYSKKRLYDDSYVFVLDEVIDNIDINNDGTISYMNDNETVALNSIINPYFLISDEEYGFADLYTVGTLYDLYETTDYDTMKELFKNYMSRIIRVGILDEEHECVRVATIAKDVILNMPLTNKVFTQFVVDVHSYGSRILLDRNALRIIGEDLENERFGKAIAEFKCLNKVIDEFTKMNQKGYLTINLKEKPVVEKIDYENKLNSLIGLNDVKLKVDKLKKNLLYRNKIDLLNKDGISNIKLDDLNLNMVFTGNPGTGKTTIARIIAGILYDLGYVKNPGFVESTAQDFVAGYVGQTAIKTRKLIDDHKGAVILIDEAYVLASEGQLYADEALAEILKEMESRDTVFIFAGYKKEMQKFIDMNSGLFSRVGSYIDFEDYSLDELMDILDRKINLANLKISKQARENVRNIIANHMTNERFGNGRFIDQLYEKIMLNHAYNTFDSDSISKLKTIHVEDLMGVDEELKDNSKVKEKIGFKP